MGEKNERRLLGRQRRANSPNGPRVHRHVVRTTAEEEVQLLARAIVREVTVPRLMIESAMNLHIETDTDRHAAIAEIFAVQRLLANVANNVNQLARWANEERAFPAEAVAVVAEYRAIVSRLNAALDRISGA